MLAVLAARWGLLLTRAARALVFGLILLPWPEPTAGGFALRRELTGQWPLPVAAALSLTMAIWCSGRAQICQRSRGHGRVPSALLRRPDGIRASDVAARA